MPDAPHDPDGIETDDSEPPRRAGEDSGVIVFAGSGIGFAQPEPAAAPAPAGPSALWRWVPILLFVAGTWLLAGTQRKIGYAWDEAYYYEPARLAAAWIAEGFPGAFPPDRETLDEFWEERHEHPSVQKILSGLSLLFFEETIGPIAAMRLPMAFLFGGTLVIIYLLGRRAWTAPAGLAAALAYLCMPQVFGLSHFAAMEPVLAFTTVFAVYCFARGIDSRWWSCAAGASLGLLLASKINGFFLIPPLVLWGYVYARPRCVHNFFAMATLGPIVFVALWPWLWPAPAARLLDYLQFHAQHQQTAVYFLGEKFGYGDANAPWYYPSAMIGATTPVAILIFAAVGLLAALAGARRRPLPALFLLLFAANWALATAPSTPKYDGVRLFLPLFPFLALLAGGGAHALFTSLGGRPEPADAPALAWPGRAKLAAWCVGLAFVAEASLGAVKCYPFFLSYYNSIVGGVAGAERLGFETTYWGEALNEDALAALNDPQMLPRGARLKPLALHELCFQQLQGWEMLRRDIRIGGPPPYDAHLLLWRRGFFARPERALAETGMFPVIAQWKLDGVPLLTLYKTGADFERFWPTLPADAPPETQAAPGGAPPEVTLPEAEPQSSAPASAQK